MECFRKGNTKGKLATRAIPVIQELRIRLQAYKPRDDSPWLFPGNPDRSRASTHLHRDSALWIVRVACQRVGIEGVSSHSFRCTALTSMSNAGIPLRVIQEISGHRTLDELYKYLEVKEEQVLGAVSSLSLLAPVESNDFEKTGEDDITRLGVIRKEPAKNSDRFQPSQTTQAAEAFQPKLSAHGGNENSLT